MNLETLIDFPDYGNRTKKLIRREVHLSVRVAGITLSKPLLYDITHAYDLHPVVKVMCYK